MNNKIEFADESKLEAIIIKFSKTHATLMSLPLEKGYKLWETSMACIGILYCITRNVDAVLTQDIEKTIGVWDDAVQKLETIHRLATALLENARSETH